MHVMCFLRDIGYKTIVYNIIRIKTPILLNRYIKINPTHTQRKTKPIINYPIDTIIQTEYHEHDTLTFNIC